MLRLNIADPPENCASTLLVPGTLHRLICSHQIHHFRFNVLGANGGPANRMLFMQIQYFHTKILQENTHLEFPSVQ